MKNTKTKEHVKTRACKCKAEIEAQCEISKFRKPVLVSCEKCSTWREKEVPILNKI